MKIEMVTTPAAGAILYVFFRGKYILPASILRHDLVQGNAIYQLLQLKTPKKLRHKNSDSLPTNDKGPLTSPKFNLLAVSANVKRKK